MRYRWEGDAKKIEAMLPMIQRPIYIVFETHYSYLSNHGGLTLSKFIREIGYHWNPTPALISRTSSRLTEEVDPDMWQVTIWLETQISAKFYSYNNNNTTIFRIFKFNVGVALVEEVPAPAWEQNNAWLQSATKMLGQLQLTHVQGVYQSPQCLET